MSSQPITEASPLQGEASEHPANEGIIVPLELPGLSILHQEVQADGSIEVEVMGTNERACCPHCQRICVKVHDTRLRRKRDVELRGHPIVLVLHKRRFKCFGCRRTFTEPDSACGRYRRMTVRLRQKIGEQACSQPIAHVAAAFEVGPRFVEGCLEAVAAIKLAKRGRTLDETAPLPTSRYLGIDEFARRKGHRYDTILFDLAVRHVLEVSPGRTKEEVSRLLERLTDCEAVEAESRGNEHHLPRGDPVVLASRSQCGGSLSCDPACGQSRKPGDRPLGQEAGLRRPSASLLNVTRKTSLPRKSCNGRPWLWPFLRSPALGSSKQHCGPDMQPLRRPQQRQG
jgi:hypothetical protein